MYQIRVKGLDEALSYLSLQSKLAQDRMDELLKRLSDIGIAEARVHFNSATVIDNPSPVSVYAEETENGIAVIAEGEQVAFIEFGAGVFYNGAESYLGVRPSDIAKIGEYGQGKGKQKAWGYYGDDGTVHITHGNPPANAMYFAAEEILKSVDRIAKEVFAI